jgi:hypothetical protein
MSFSHISFAWCYCQELVTFKVEATGSSYKVYRTPGNSKKFSISKADTYQVFYEKLFQEDMCGPHNWDVCSILSYEHTKVQNGDALLKPWSVFACLSFDASAPWKGFLCRTGNGAPPMPLAPSGASGAPSGASGATRRANRNERPDGSSTNALAKKPRENTPVGCNFEKGGHAYCDYLKDLVKAISGENAFGDLGALETTVTAIYPSRRDKQFTIMLGRELHEATPGLVLTCFPQMIRVMTEFHLVLRGPLAQTQLISMFQPEISTLELTDLITEVKELVESFVKVIRNHAALLDRVKAAEHRKASSPSRGRTRTAGENMLQSLHYFAVLSHLLALCLPPPGAFGDGKCKTPDPTEFLKGVPPEFEKLVQSFNNLYFDL